MTGRKPISSLALLALGISVFCPQFQVPARAQAIGEYGGLMAMPKGVPTGSVNALTTPYRNLPNMTPSATPSSAGSSSAVDISNNSAVTVDALGNSTVDPVKAQMLGAKAVKLYEQAKAKAHSATPDLRGAEASLREAINIRNGIWGYSDPMMPKMLTLMGDIYVKLKHPTEAESCYKNALVYLAKKEGSGSYDRLDTVAKLGALYKSQGNFKEAVSFYQQTALIKERQLGMLDPSVLDAKIQWAEVSAEAGKADAETLFQAVATTLEKADRSKHSYAHVQEELLKSYGALLKKNGKSDEIAALEARLNGNGANAAIPAAVSGESSSSTSAAAPATVPAMSSPAMTSPAVVNSLSAPAAVPAATAPAVVPVSTSATSAGDRPMTIEEKIRAEASTKGNLKIKKLKDSIEL